jgi:hypothetical protein
MFACRGLICQAQSVSKHGDFGISHCIRMAAVSKNQPDYPRATIVLRAVDRDHARPWTALARSSLAIHVDAPATAPVPQSSAARLPPATRSRAMTASPAPEMSGPARVARESILKWECRPTPAVAAESLFQGG